MRTSKIEPCVDCGKKLPRKELNRLRRCPDCARKKMLDTATQLYQRSGPEYDHWKEACKAAVQKL